jgi:hypothetical protein
MTAEIEQPSEDVQVQPDAISEEEAPAYTPPAYTVKGNRPELVISHKPSAPLEIEIDLNALGWGDMKRLGNLTSVNTEDEAQMDEMEKLIQKVLVDRDVDSLPLPAMMAIIDTVMSSLALRSGPAQKN